ncbi:GNAT family N-acetyltransferase [Aggregatilinea lenta]|uniref:GNAT family N-acetyltransferase n=1 Tax=Aggregatilinea lenta TaxID=913108 RepID=UPI000E5A1031|nr:GNAT family N-acetyltransferase [Aggregatilinea lenta]
MKLTFYDSVSLFADLADEWDLLLAESSANRVFSSYVWQTTWWEAYQPGQIWALAARDDNGTLQGIAPWFLCGRDPQALKVSQIGCVDVTDYLEVIVRKGQEEAVFTAFAEYIAAHTELYNILELCNIPESSPMLAWLPDLMRARALSCVQEIQDVCPVILLPDAWEDYVNSLDKKNRHELRRKLRRAGLVTWYIVGPDHDIEAEMERFFTLMRSSSSLKAEFLEDPHHAAFFSAVTPKLLEQRWLQLAFLMIGGKPAATYLNFIIGERVMVYNSGHNPDLSNYSPGIVLLARLIEYAIEHSYRTFDFLRGDEAYKYDLGGRDTQVYSLTIRAGAQD